VVAHNGNANPDTPVSPCDGTHSMKQEYGPFGEVLRATGPMAKK